MIRIPLVDLNDFVIEAALEETTYFLRFSWNSEAQFWTLGIRNARNEIILQSIVMVANTPLLRQFPTYAVPPGELIAYMDNPNGIIGRESFLTDEATLYYLPSTEVIDNAAIR